MRKYLVFSLIAFLFFSCGNKDREMNYDEVYNILIQNEGDLIGGTIGSNWGEIKKNIEKNYGDVVDMDSDDAAFGGFKIKYKEKSTFSVNVSISEGNISNIDISIMNKKENKEKLIALHDKLTDYITFKFPNGHEVFPGGEYAGYQSRKIGDSGNNITVRDLDTGQETFMFMMSLSEAF